MHLVSEHSGVPERLTFPKVTEGRQPQMRQRDTEGQAESGRRSNRNCFTHWKTMEKTFILSLLIFASQHEVIAAQSGPADEGKSYKRDGAGVQLWPPDRRGRSFNSAEEKRGLYRNQHKSEDPHPDLLLAERHDTSSQIVGSDHLYYTSKVYGAGDEHSKEMWVNIEETKQWTLLNFLSNTHRQAERVRLSFNFPFYGHLLKDITVATGGFIYTGDFIHKMLTATQYIAPLMANFDPSLSPNSTVSYCDNGTSLVVEWSRMQLQDNSSAGSFTFQASLHSDGRIVFAYKQVPVDVGDISSENHPVKVGLSDAFVVLHEIEQIPNIRRRTIYQYHKVDIPRSKISNYTAVELLPLPTCLQFSSCDQCIRSQIGFNCSWCNRLKRCSSGFDRHRQDWVDFGCPSEKRDPLCLRAPDSATALADTSEQRGGSGKTPTAASKTSSATKSSWFKSSSKKSKWSGQRATEEATDAVNKRSEEDIGSGLQSGLLVAVVTVMIVMVTILLVFMYMYSHPTSSASLYFIERRPTHWPILKFRRGSGRPSYAEVEAPGQDREDTVIIDLKQTFAMINRRESEQREGFFVPDQRERVLSSESS